MPIRCTDHHAQFCEELSAGMAARLAAKEPTPELVDWVFRHSRPAGEILGIKLRTCAALPPDTVLVADPENAQQAQWFTFKAEEKHDQATK